MKSKIRLHCFLVLWTLHWSSAVASPTSNEYEPCHRTAAALLQACLDENPGSINDTCWTKARSANQSCYTMVNDQHRKPDRKEVEARRKAEQARRLEQERRETQQTQK